MSEPEIRETWSTVELPILRAIVSAQQTQQTVWNAAIEAVPELDEHLRRTVFFWLHDGGYITAKVTPDRWNIEVTGATPKTLRLTGAWPTAESELARLIALLNEKIASTDGAEKTKLERLREALVGMGQGTATSLFSAYLSRYLGI